MAAVYVDMMSQPARALVIFIRLNRLPVKEKLVNIAKGQQRDAQYLAVNALGKIPCFQDGDWVLPESASILRYLADSYVDKVADHWYPENPRRRAKVESAMDWHHGNMRQGSALLVWNRVFAPASGLQFSDHLARRGAFVLEQSLQGLEQYWLSTSPFVAGDEISVADLLISTELAGLRMLDGARQSTEKEKDMDAWLAPYPKVTAWLEAVQQATDPVWSEVHAVMHRAAKRLKDRQMSAKSKL